MCKWSCDWYVRRHKERQRAHWWVVAPEDERGFSLGVLQRWRRVLPQLCCSCLNSIQDLKRKTQLRWLLTQQALATVNNSSSVAYMLFTLTINKLSLWVCVCLEVKGGPLKKFLNQTCVYTLKSMYLLSVRGERKWWYALIKRLVLVCETPTCAGSEC